MISGIPMVLVYVTDVATSARWYRETLELPVVYQNQRYASLGVGSQRLGLHAGKPDQGSSEQSGSMPVFKVDDYLESKSKLESRGCDFFFENEAPNAIFGSFRDPDGNPLQIMQTR